MRLRPQILISLSPLLLSWQNVGAQPAPADDFFHTGAQCYITNNIPTAKEQVAAGLKLYPDDVKLKKLEELLNQQQQSQDNQQDQQDKNDDKKQNQDKKDQQQNQQPKDEQKKQQEQKQAQDKKREQEKNPGDKPKEQKGEQQQARAGQMTPQQAQRLLDTQKGTEQVLWFKPEGKPDNPNHPVKDW